MTQPALFPDLAEIDARNGANGASHVDGSNEKSASLASYDGQAQPLGPGDVPAALRVFAAVDAGQLTAHYWRAWTADTDPALAALEYRQRLGTWPETVTREPHSGLVLAGPVTSERTKA